MTLATWIPILMQFLLFFLAVILFAWKIPTKEDIRELKADIRELRLAIRQGEVKLESKLDALNSELFNHLDGHP